MLLLLLLSFLLWCADDRRNNTAAAVVLYDTNTLYVLQSRASRSRACIPGTWYGICKHPTYYTNKMYGGLSRALKLLVSMDCLIARLCDKQSNASLMRRRRRRSSASPWDVDPLRSTTLRGIRTARSGLGQRTFRSSALHRTSCHASVSVMLEKRGGRCRTDGPIPVLSCQMRHTIAAIKAAWCLSLC